MSIDFDWITGEAVFGMVLWRRKRREGREEEEEDLERRERREAKIRVGWEEEG